MRIFSSKSRFSKLTFSSPGVLLQMSEELEIPGLYWFGVLGIFESAIGTIGNALTLFYFLSRKSMNASFVLYIGINISDLCICLLMFPVGISGMLEGGEGWFTDSVYCPLWGLLWAISIRMSVYIIGILSISRTLSHLRPLHPIKIHVILQLIGWYFFILILQSSLPFFYNKSYYFSRDSTMCLWQLTAVFEVFSTNFKIVFFLSTVMEFIVPAIPIIISCFISFVTLRTDKLRCTQSAGLQKRKATVTVILLTISYVVFNIPLCFILSRHAVFLFCNKCFNYDTLKVSAVLEYLFSSHVFALNAIANVIIYFSRISDMKCFLYEWKALFCEKIENVFRRSVKPLPQSSIGSINEAR